MTRQPYLQTTAEVSEDGVYRYSLTRRWSAGGRAVLFVGLNPSTADAQQDDPTIRRCVGYARDWGYDRLLMGNVCAFRSTDPAALLTASDPVGPDNQAVLQALVGQVDLVIAAWGKARLHRHARVLAGWIRSLPHAHYLKLNGDGSPAHPLYLKKSLTPLRFWPSPAPPGSQTP